MSKSLLTAWNKEDQNYSNPIQSLVDDPFYAMIVMTMVSIFIITLVAGFLYSAFCSYPKYRKICFCQTILNENNKKSFKTVANQETVVTSAASNKANVNGLRINTKVNSFKENQFPVSISNAIKPFDDFEESDDDEEADIEKNTPHYYTVIDVPEDDMATK